MNETLDQLKKIRGMINADDLKAFKSYELSQCQDKSLEKAYEDIINTFKLSIIAFTQGASADQKKLYKNAYENSYASIDILSSNIGGKLWGCVPATTMLRNNDGINNFSAGSPLLINLASAYLYTVNIGMMHISYFWLLSSGTNEEKEDSINRIDDLYKKHEYDGYWDIYYAISYSLTAWQYYSGMNLNKLYEQSASMNQSTLAKKMKLMMNTMYPDHYIDVHTIIERDQPFQFCGKGERQIILSRQDLNSSQNLKINIVVTRAPKNDTDDWTGYLDIKNAKFLTKVNQLYAYNYDVCQWVYDNSKIFGDIFIQGIFAYFSDDFQNQDLVIASDLNTSAQYPLLNGRMVCNEQNSLKYCLNA
ncbi:UNKNOWN [Stylonychia lemnae]|uniref:Uncharacterized protein n=1 Tax=Stylonychia lemnae TaxID=5949 RepID=A0A078B1B1_STYLE|nr:UNKNOWN [Stylonychia lemnae]|eukprot:CDW86943.1 UNKNOWN [Stylonychia lemnae]